MDAKRIRKLVVRREHMRVGADHYCERFFEEAPQTAPHFDPAQLREIDNWRRCGILIHCRAARHAKEIERSGSFGIE